MEDPDPPNHVSPASTRRHSDRTARHYDGVIALWNRPGGAVVVGTGTDREPFATATLTREQARALARAILDHTGDDAPITFSPEDVETVRLAASSSPDPTTVRLRRTDGNTCTVPVELWDRTVGRGLVNLTQVADAFDAAILLGEDPAVAVTRFLQLARDAGA